MVYTSLPLSYYTLFPAPFAVRLIHSSSFAYIRPGYSAQKNFRGNIFAPYLSSIAVHKHDKAGFTLKDGAFNLPR